jgi:hypothetical protein
MKKSTLLLIIDKLADQSEHEGDDGQCENDSFLKSFISEYDNLQDFDSCSELSFEISSLEFDLFYESISELNNILIEIPKISAEGD